VTPSKKSVNSLTITSASASLRFYNAVLAHSKSPKPPWLIGGE
jgi:hypothetical protein